MPVPGPRVQTGPLEGYRNPGGELPDRIHGRPHVAPEIDGRTPGTMFRNLRGNVLGFGTLRFMYRQSINYLAAQSPYSWTDNAPGPGGPAFVPSHGFGITRSLRYFARSIYAAGGTDNTRLSDLHTVILPRVRSKPVTVAAGSKRSAPTVRNRLTSFGSRVQPINQASSAAEGP